MKNVHDLDYYKKAKDQVKKYEKLLTDLDKAENILYNHVYMTPVWNLIQSVVDMKVLYSFEYQGWKDILDSKGEIND